MSPDPYADLSPADALAARASDATQRGIIAGRLRVARGLQAPPDPLEALKAAWAPVLHRDRAAFTGPADTTAGVYVAPGPPEATNLEPVPTTIYMDQSTGVVYEAQEGPTP